MADCPCPFGTSEAAGQSWALTVRPHRRAKQSRVAQLFGLGSIPSAAELTRPTVDMAASRRALHRPLRIGAVFGDEHELEQGALLRIHGGFLELRRHHLAEALEAADFDIGIGAELARHDPSRA